MKLLAVSAFLMLIALCLIFYGFMGILHLSMKKTMNKYVYKPMEGDMDD